MSVFEETLLNELQDYGRCKTCGSLFYFGSLADLCPNDGAALQVVHREQVIAEDHVPSTAQYRNGCRCVGCRELQRMRVQRQRSRRE
jgi:hypothetical protein